MSDFDCGDRPTSLSERLEVARKSAAKAQAVYDARARQFRHDVDRAIGIVTDVGETDQGLMVEVLLDQPNLLDVIDSRLERNTVQFLIDPRFGFQVDRSGPSAGAAVPSRRVRFRAWRQCVRVRLAERIGGEGLHEDCY